MSKWYYLKTQDCTRNCSRKQDFDTSLYPLIYREQMNLNTWLHASRTIELQENLIVISILAYNNLVQLRIRALKTYNLIEREKGRGLLLILSLVFVP